MAVRTRAKADGYTLIEMLVVISVISILMGIGVGVYLKLQSAYHFRAVYNQTQNVVRAVQNASRIHRTEGVVHWDKEDGVVWGSVDEIVAYWPFEVIDDNSTTPGARDIYGRVYGGESTVGRVGQAVYFGLSGGYVDCGNPPQLNPPEGVRIEAWIYPEAYPTSENGSVIVGRRGAYVFRIFSDGLLEAQFADADVDSGLFQISLHRWSHVVMMADPRRIALYVDGVERGSAPGHLEWKPSTSHVTLSAKEAPFFGILDEVVIAAVETSKQVRMLDGCALVGDVMDIHFTPRGTLDMQHHAGPVSLGMTFKDLRRTFQVGLQGDLRETYRE